MPHAVLPPVRACFRAVATTVVPAAEALDGAGWARAEALVESALAARPAAQRRQLRLFLRALDLLPLARWGRRFTALPPGRRARVLAALERAPVMALRRGVWGVRTLAFMGWYGQPSVRRRIGYRADPRGWSVRDGGAPPADFPPSRPPGP